MNIPHSASTSAFSSFKTTILFGDTGYGAAIIHPDSVELPSTMIKEYTKSYCGAGSGIGDLLVPEKVFGVRVTPACFVHDKMFEMGMPSLGDFKVCNAVFITNLTSLIAGQSHSSKLNLLYHLRLYRTVTYYNAVDTIGKKVYFKLKEDQINGKSSR
jgi:hypothetical protein